MGWIARLWTDVFPLANWSMQFLAMVNAAIGLWAVDLIARQFANGDKRVLILLLLMLTPAYQFHAQRFNANAVLLSMWPLTTYCFLRSFQTRTALWAVAAGAAAGLAMLGKYYSIFLLAGFASAAAVHHLRRSYFGSPAPWISTLAGLLVLSPHLYWLFRTGAPTFHHAMSHAGANHLTALHDALNFVLGLIAALSISALTWGLVAGRRLSRALSDFSRMDDGLKLVLLIGAATVLFPILTCLIVGTDLPSLWGLQGLFLFVVPAVASTEYAIERFYTVNTLVLVSAIALVAVAVAAPIHAAYRNKFGYEEGRNFYLQAALELTREWHELADQPLPVVSGDDALAFAVAFYSPNHPHYSSRGGHEIISRTANSDRGWAALCFIEQVECVDWMRKKEVRGQRAVESQIEIRASLLGSPGVRRTVVLLLVLPKQENPSDAQKRSAPAP